MAAVITSKVPRYTQSLPCAHTVRAPWQERPHQIGRRSEMAPTNLIHVRRGLPP